MTPFQRRCLAVVAFVLAFSGLLAPAAVVSSSSNVAVQSAPSSLAVSAVESNSQLFLFAESQDIILASDLSVDIVQPGSYDEFGWNVLKSFAGEIEAGTLVDSWLLHFDPMGNPTNSQAPVLSGVLTFSAPILGLIVRHNALNNTDALLGAPGTAYGKGGGRGLESGQEDVISLSADRHTLTVNRLFETGSVDQVRIVTSAVIPEPTTRALAFAGLVVMAHRLRRRSVNR